MPVLLLLSGTGAAEPYCRLKGFQDHGVPTLGGGGLEDLVHIGQLEDALGSYPRYHNVVTSCSGTLEPSPWGVPYLGGVHEYYDCLDWPPTGQLEGLQALMPPAQRFPATLDDGRRITTRLEFVPEGYYLTRFLPQEGTSPDTSYLDAQVFHAYPGVPVLWIGGVGQVEGIVGQAMTIVSEDSLYITGDLIVSGTQLLTCGDPETFGMTPEGTEVLIGLIGFKDVIVAATLENGAVNGVSNTPNPCGLDYSPVVTQCEQGRRDVIITASIMAMGGRFHTEVWINSVGNDMSATPYDSLYCGEVFETIPHGIPGCGANTGIYDRRGTLWFCGSLAQDCGGRHNRYPPGMEIGYTSTRMRYDPNLRESAPPFWPGFDWIDEDPLTVELSAVAQALCGRVLHDEEFLQPLEDGAIALQVTAHPQSHGGYEQVRFTAWLDGQPVESRLDNLAMGTSRTYQPGYYMPDDGSHELYFTVEWDAQIWNAGGTQCRWIFELEDVDPPVITLSPDLEAWCGQPVDWFDFHSRWVRGEVYLDVSASPQAAGGFETFRLQTWINGQCTDSTSVVVEAGEAFRHVPPVLQDRQDEIRSLFVAVRWDYQVWNGDGTFCRIDFPDPDPPTLTLSPLAESLCGQATEWALLLPQLESGALWVDFQAHPEALEGQELVSVLTWTDQGLADSLGGPVAAGETVRLFPNLASLPEPDPLAVYMEIRWDNESWNPAGSDCHWSVGTVSVPRHELQPQPMTLTLRIAPNPANPTFTVEYEVPVAGETSLELYDLRGRKVQNLVSGPQPAGTHRVTVDLGPGASGLYFVRLLTPAGQRVEKVLVVR